MITSHFLEFTIDGCAGYDHFGDVYRYIINGVAPIFRQVGLLGFPDMSNSESFIDSFVYPDSQEYFTSP
ncbi:hypothetical protein BK662_24470 [Pseudomonas frederiksbergensis]|uniref:Uncharacterized protein n=1 Tax=Pseudomonas frederiksbergensis TaxID=104087 RepID=A0A423HG42_9PSED|nr:hypothetical protein BK662_24470 [Pseudomonas frederiksbergensis]